MSSHRTNFNTFIYRVLKSVHPDTGITGASSATINNMVKFLIENMMSTINRLMLRSGKKTISSKEVISAVKLTLPRELANHAISHCQKSEALYLKKRDTKERERGENGKIKPLARAKAAGLMFPITRIEEMMLNLATVRRKTDTAAVYFTAVCEYLVAEILELSGNITRDNKRKRITPRHIMLAVRQDEELNDIFSRTVFAGGVALQSRSIEEECVSTKKK